ncbi:MAG: polyprenyl diphosphate synthase [Candidatus Caldarchaeum sp.]|nr:polyprenyl diphosphate synthase [Candidatus Caldarchaeum sp.]
MLRSLLTYLGVYWIYERWLYHIVSQKPLPKHVALILDGNRRWAMKRGWPSWLGHRFGADKVEEILSKMLKLGIKTVTLYVLSTENLGRRPEEVAELLRLIRERAERLRNSPDIHKNKVRVKVIGRKEFLPEDVASALTKLEEATKNYDKHFLNLAVAYGGRLEILDAVRTIASEVKSGFLDLDQINEQTFEKHLYTGDVPNAEPDLVIRTSGEARISNFLLWQSAYSELVFQDVYFPDFRMIDLLRAVRTYQHRERRFGL